jgi:hypothetical protein
MFYLQSFHADLGTPTIMALSSPSSQPPPLPSPLSFHRSNAAYTVVSGISTSLLLETVLLRLGRDQLPWGAAAKTAAGMSLISMLTMEAAENAVDFHLTGGMVRFDDPAFWGAAVVSIAAGFLAPLPYNYVRLRKYGKACH